MNFRPGYMVFMVVLVAVVNYVVLTLFFERFALFISLLIALLYPCGRLLEMFAPSKYSSLLYLAGVLWFQLVSSLFLPALVFVVLSWRGIMFWWTNAVLLALAIVVTVLGLLYAKTWKITELTLRDSRIEKPCTLVHITDVHAFGASANQQLQSVIDRALDLQPDALLLTGDIIDEPALPRKDVWDLRCPVPMYYTLGNHEIDFVGKAIAKERTKDFAVQLLENTSVTFSGVQCIGISDSPSSQVLEKSLPGLVEKDKFSILLFHRPKGMHIAASSGVDLMLSGHTHGGVHFPFHPLVWFAYKKYYRGLHKINKLWLYTSNGSGTFNWPLRLFSPQELVKITLLPKKK